MIPSDAIPEKFAESFPVIPMRTGILAREGRVKEAKALTVALQRINPNFRISHAQYFLKMQDQEYVTAFEETLRKAGLPD